MQRQFIKIPDSPHNPQEVGTPSWQASESLNFNNIATSNQNMTNPKSLKVSRLDELLSRNELIYQNMKNQYEEISRSNKKIDANLHNIKPLTDVDYQEQSMPSQDTFSREISIDRERSVPEMNQKHFTLAEHKKYGRGYHEGHEDYSDYNNLKSNKIYMNSEDEASPRKHLRMLKKQTPLKTSFVAEKSKEEPKMEYQQLKKENVSAKQPNHLVSSYHEPDSSPIHSEFFMEAPIQEKKFMQYEDKSSEICEEVEFRKSREQNYHTFSESEELGFGENTKKLQKKIEHTYEKTIKLPKTESDNNENLEEYHFLSPEKRSISLESPYPSIELTELLIPPPQLSLLYVPFNKLYSSPILQLSSKNELVLVRQSRTQISANSNNRIINGLKYKNLNLVHDEIQLYEALVMHVRAIHNVLDQSSQQYEDTIQQYNSYGQEKIYSRPKGRRSIDVGIVGAQNCLKKKLHFGLTAHIYADAVKVAEGILLKQENCTLVLGIEHQEQESLCDPYMIKYEGELRASESENEMVYANIKAVLEEIFSCMKMKMSQEANSHRIRVTKVYLKLLPTESQREEADTIKEETFYSCKVISTNKVSKDLMESLELDAAVWCINPLFKYYKETHQTLDCYNAYKNKIRDEAPRKK